MGIVVCSPARITGATFQSTSSGTAAAVTMKPANVLRPTNRGAKGYTTVLSPTNAAFHWIDDSVA